MHARSPPHHACHHVGTLPVHPSLPPPLSRVRGTPGPPTVWPPRPLHPDGMMGVEPLRHPARYFDETATVRQKRQGGAVRLLLRRVPSECRAGGSGNALAASSVAMPWVRNEDLRIPDEKFGVHV